MASRNPTITCDSSKVWRIGSQAALLHVVHETAMGAEQPEYRDRDQPGPPLGIRAAERPAQPFQADEGEGRRHHHAQAFANRVSAWVALHAATQSQ